MSSTSCDPQSLYPLHPIGINFSKSPRGRAGVKLSRRRGAARRKKATEAARAAAAAWVDLVVALVELVGGLQDVSNIRIYGIYGPSKLRPTFLKCFRQKWLNGF